MPAGCCTGGTFDGRYIYYSVNGSGLIVRFDAKEPASLPPTSGSSFL